MIHTHVCHGRTESEGVGGGYRGSGGEGAGTNEGRTGLDRGGAEGSHCSGTGQLTLMYTFTVCQIWSISLSARSGLFHCPPDLVYFTVCPIWSISLSARFGLFHCPLDLVYFAVCQIWADLIYFTVCQTWSFSVWVSIEYHFVLTPPLEIRPGSIHHEPGSGDVSE